MSLVVAVIDATNGRPAVGVSVELTRESDGRWLEIARARTDERGRMTSSGNTGRGRYRLVMDLDEYFAGFGVTPVQSTVATVFRIFRQEDHVQVIVLATSTSSGVHVVLDGAG